MRLHYKCRVGVLALAVLLCSGYAGADADDADGTFAGFDTDQDPLDPDAVPFFQSAFLSETSGPVSVARTRCIVRDTTSGSRPMGYKLLNRIYVLSRVRVKITSYCDAPVLYQRSGASGDQAIPRSASPRSRSTGRKTSHSSSAASTSITG